MAISKNFWSVSLDFVPTDSSYLIDGAGVVFLDFKAVKQPKMTQFSL